MVAAQLACGFNQLSLGLGSRALGPRLGRRDAPESVVETSVLG
jgi:hypothetical protein